MREVIAVCRSGKRSRERVERVLDRYFWRIGDRTWRGKATNACLDRAARELRRGAKRNTAVAVHEIRSAHESRVPLIRIGSRSAFSEEGVAPIASHPASVRRRGDVPRAEASAAAAVRIAALFHDLGKATVLFQNKLKRALKSKTGKGEADAIRHELHSAAVWDSLFGDIADEDLPGALEALTAERIDAACNSMIRRLGGMPNASDRELDLAFVHREGTLAHLIGMLILTHHRLPEGDSDHLTLLARSHVRSDENFNPRRDLEIESGTPFWHEPWWQNALARERKRLDPAAPIASADIALRASLMLADHVGSAQKEQTEGAPDHLANTTKTPERGQKPVAADALSTHVRRVYGNTKGAFDMFHRYRERFPGLDEGQIPVDVMHPRPSPASRFRWQSEAAGMARSLCEQSEGGFFACLMAGTGTGKTRGAPTILANAAMGDARPERRYLRMNLGLGLRTLATQSAQEYVADLGFRDQDVSVMVGEAPLEFTDKSSGQDDEQEVDTTGSESLVKLPEWLQVEYATGGVPREGDEGEPDWLRSLSIDTDRGLPAFCDLVLEHAGSRNGAGRRFLEPPIMVGTIDHLMGVASPLTSHYLIQSIRVMTSDLIIDEIDQFDGEDIAAIGRLIYQAGAAGRRVVIMSATLAPDIARSLHTAYTRGWSAFAAARGVRDHVNLLCAGDTPGSCFTNEGGRDLEAVMADSRRAILDGIRNNPAARRAEILPRPQNWEELVEQVDAGCTRMHTDNAVAIDGFRVSVGLIRMARIAHTARLATQLRSGNVNGRLRVLLCLHAQFPRLHREWIESRLKRALTRKGEDPDAGVSALCHAQGLFERATELGTREIEIVVVSSPVIETGNDLDFDYAILDPNSTRALIQPGGRVRRHRPPEGDHINILILGVSPIVMQHGRLEKPGVETGQPKETGVATPRLDDFPGRDFAGLAGDERFATVTAAPILFGEGNFPLRDAETALRAKLIRADTDETEAPLGRYTCRLNARLNRTMTRTRRFRRSEKGSIVYQKVGEDLHNAKWYLDLALGPKDSALRDACKQGLVCDEVAGDHLFDEVTEQAWLDYSGGQRDMTEADLRSLMRVEVPDYVEELKPEMTYTPFTGFTRGQPEDLYQPVPRRSENQ